MRRERLALITASFTFSAVKTARIALSFVERSKRLRRKYCSLDSFSTAPLATTYSLRVFTASSLLRPGS